MESIKNWKGIIPDKINDIIGTSNIIFYMFNEFNQGTVFVVFVDWKPEFFAKLQKVTNL